MAVIPPEIRQIQLRRGTAAQWTSVNPTLLLAEMGLESDTDYFKIGNGVDPWNDLPYGGLAGVIETYEQTTQPTTTKIGAVWIDPSETPPIGVGPPGPPGEWTALTQAEFDALTPPGPDPDILDVIVS
jgi:hypothetical protein